MRTRTAWMYPLYACLLTMVCAAPGRAQLNTTFQSVFQEILDVRLKRSASPGGHGEHFLPAAAVATSELTPALNSLIAGNLSSFPLTSTGTGISFEFVAGQPVSVSGSLGPVFSENAQSLGKGKFNVGVNYSYLSLDKIRGVRTEDMRFTFTHQLLGNDQVLGTDPTESDYIDVFMNMNITAHLAVVYASAGITRDLDIGVAVPLVSMRLQGNALARINSFTYGRFNAAIHSFGQDITNPILETTVPYDQSKTGLGDVAVRIKYTFLKGTGFNAAGLVDVRLPTGDKDNYLGLGKTNVRIFGIISKKMGDFTPHLNLGYERRTSNIVSDAVEFAAGFDQKALAGLTFAFDVLGAIDVNKERAIKLFPGTRTIIFRNSTTGQYSQNISLSNIPDRDQDNEINASFGLRWGISNAISFLGNVLVPLNDGGLRSSIAPTVGLSVLF